MGKQKLPLCLMLAKVRYRRKTDTRNWFVGTLLPSGPSRVCLPFLNACHGCLFGARPSGDAVCLAGLGRRGVLKSHSVTH